MARRRLWRMWWSGIFAAAAFVHLMRTLASAPVSVGTVAIPLWVSWVAFPAAGFIAGWLMRVALEEKATPVFPPPLALGGLHPKSLGKEEPQHAGQAYCGIQVGTSSDLSDEWLDEDE